MLGGSGEGMGGRFFYPIFPFKRGPYFLPYFPFKGRSLYIGNSRSPAVAAVTGIPGDCRSPLTTSTTVHHPADFILRYDVLVVF